MTHLACDPLYWRVLVGDVRDRLATLPDASVQCCVTSPPYWGLRDYGAAGQIGLEPTPDAYVAAMVGVFREVRRVLKDDGTLWLNLGDSYVGSGMTGGTDSKEGSAKRSDRMFHGNRRDTVPGMKQKDLAGVPWMTALALRSDGWYLRSDIIWHKPNPMPESVTDRPTKSHEYVFLLSKAERYFYDAEAIRESGNKVGTLGHLQGGNGARAGTRGGLRREYVAAKRLNPGSQALDSFEVCGDGLYSQRRNARSVWTIATQPFEGAHFATFPEALPERCIKAGSRVGDVILDPFTGSGTTGQVAIQLGRSFVGCELNPAYAELARTRIGGAAPLFATEEVGEGGLTHPEL